jgi:predicted RNase H-like HicB family nuclease
MCPVWTFGTLHGYRLQRRQHKRCQGGSGCSLRVVARHTGTRAGHSGYQKSRFATCHRYLHPQSGRILTAIIERDGDGYVALCPEFDIASQGDSIEHARDNLREALELFFETASATEVANRRRGEVFVTSVEVAVG